MSPKTKSSLFIFVIALAAAGAALLLLSETDKYYRQEDNNAGADVADKSQAAGLQTFKNDVLEFQYPQKLAVKSENDQIILNHQVPFENHGDCDMKGDENTYPMLSDFNMKIKVVEGTVAQAAKKNSPYMPAENFSGSTLKVNPGYIDKYQINDWNGFSIYEGVEGCGHTIYYFPVTSNKTLVVTKDMVQILSGIFSSNIKDELLKVPGVINNEESQQIFENIMKSLKVTNTVDTTGWKTYRNDEYGFEFKYPTDWKFSENFSGQKGFFITKGESHIGILPKGEFDYGLPGNEPTTKNIILGGRQVTVRTWTLSDKGWLRFYQFTDNINNWDICTSNLQSCNRIDVKVKDQDELALSENILSTFKFTK